MSAGPERAATFAPPSAAPTMGDKPEVSGRIGPNAITRLAEAIAALHGETAVQALFTAAGQRDHLEHRPAEMVDERDVIALHRAGRRQFGLAAFAEIARLAGRLTGDYVLANRIPSVAQRVLRPMPAALAARVLVKAIGAHAWTFVGSGEFGFKPRRGGLLLTIQDSPLARDERADQPLCDYYSETFERIFRELVSRQARVTEISCAATGASACCFDVSYRSQ